MTLIAARARVPNPFERFSKIAFELIMAVSFTGALRGAETVRFLWCDGRKKSFYRHR
jgi:hypothetical protein